MVNCGCLNPIGDLPCVNDSIEIGWGIKSFSFNNEGEVYYNEVHVGKIIRKKQQGEDLVLVYESITKRDFRTRAVVKGFYKLK